MTNPQWLTWALDQARRDLIDLTRRNRLLHAPLGGNRPWCMAITGRSPDEIFETLYRQEKFRGYSFTAREADLNEQRLVPISPSPQPTNRKSRPPNRRPQLHTRLPSDKLEKRLAKIFREQRTLEEEQGLSTLYLALGFLRWLDSEDSEESFAPLLLLPVTLTRGPGGDGYLLLGRDDDIVANTSLREKLYNNFDIKLPEIPEQEQWKPSTYFQSIVRAIRRQPRWGVDGESVGLGFFTFSKFMMWRDLQETSWPNNAMLDHPLLSVLLGQAPDFETLPPLVPDETPIDQHIDLSKCTHVIDADSSQAIVIEEAREGRNLVVQGPPGTGKSQTITNIIATAIHSGRTVLFVAEKTAALDVVHDRLRKAGFDTLCLELHSRKANKREVLTSLDRALRFSGAMQPNANIPTSLASARDKLNCWSSWIHKPIGQTGRTVFDVIGQQVKLGADGVRLIESRLDEAATWSASKLTEAKIAVDRAAETVSRLSVVPKDHPWFGTNISSQSPFDLERLTPIIKTAAEKHVALALEMKEVFAFISDNREPTIADTVTTVKAFRHVAAVPRQGRSVLANQSWVDNLAALEAAIDLGQPFAVLVGEIEDQFKPEAWTCDSGKLLLALRADGPSFLRRFSRRYREANATLRQLLHGIPPKHLKNRIIVMEKLEQAQQAGREFAKAKPLLSSALGGLWGEHKTQWAHARMLAAWARCALAEAGGARLLTFAARTRDLQAFSDFANRLESAAKAAELAFGEVQKHVQADFQMAFDCENYVRAPTATLATRLEIWEKTRDLINEWVSVRDALLHLRTEGVSAIADHLMNGSIQSKEAGPITELLIAESLWRRAISETPELTSIDGELRSNCVSDFRELDRERIRGARHEVLARYLDQRPNGYARAMGTIRAEIEKKRGHRSIRRLMSVAGSAVQRLKPIFLMSPLSVAQFLPPGQIAFDLLVIDEASQVAPEDALGAVLRAKQIVVVGDDKQLPPTNFFKMINAGEEDVEEDDDLSKPDRPNDFESVLALARTRGMSERMLAWHYRSRHPSLIALSNEECYGGRLLLPPSPFVKTPEFGLSLVRTPRGHYERGSTRCDLVQAEEIAKAVAQHIKHYPNKSLGVACLSIQQRNAVDDMIDKLGIRAEVEEFTPKEERLFVKNLEAVQGDERDVILISVGYGVAPNQSRPFLNFGPVSQAGGERRLNVLASRAREKCVVFSSITAADIPADVEVRGTRMLRALLSFAETGKLGSGVLSGGSFESPFEEAVARVIREAGFYVHPQVGVKSFRIDLGVVDPPKPGEYILGVECDGAAYHSARSARDRDRLRQEVLEGLRLHRIWSTDWFRSPQRETTKLLAAIRNAQKKASDPKVEVTSDDEDFPEPEEEGAAEAIPAGEIEESEAPSNTIEYRECALTTPLRRELLDLSIGEISRLALAVVEAEGPIHTEEVARRIREAFGLQKTGRKILAHIRSGLAYLSKSGSVTKDGEFWSAVGHELQTVRHRRNAAFSLRRANMIAPTEYRLALLTIISEAVTISRDELTVQTARLFGFDRTGVDLKEAIERQAAALVKAARLQLDGNFLRLP